MLYQMPTYVQRICVHVFALAYAAAQEGKVLFLCIVSKVLVYDRHMTWTVRYVYGKLQPINLVPCRSLHERTPLTSVLPCVWAEMNVPEAQSEIRYKRENIRGYQANVNLHPSLLHGEKLHRGLALRSKFVGYHTTETRNSCLLLTQPLSVHICILLMWILDLGHCLVLYNLESFLLVYPQTYLFTCFSSLAACHQLTGRTVWPPFCPLVPWSHFIVDAPL